MSVVFRGGALLFGTGGLVFNDECCCGLVCNFCSGTVPAQMRIALTGFSNNGCSTCANLNTNHDLDVNTTPDSCEWLKADLGIGSPSCLADFFLSLSASGSDVVLRLLVALERSGGITATHTFEKTYTSVSEIDCASLSGESLTYIGCSGTCPPFGLNTPCNVTTPTATVTAL